MLKFLSLEKEAFGLDISDLSLKIIKLRKKGKSFSVASFAQVSIEPGIIEKGVIKNEEALAKIIQAACRNVEGQKLTTKYAVVSLPEERSFLQVIQMPKMDEDELASAVPFEAENYIPLPMSEVYLDFQAIEPIKDHLDHLDVLLVAMPKKIVNSYVSCLKKAGLIPLILEIESEAIARAMIKDEASPAPVALIDLGTNGTDFIVFAGRSVQFTHSIPVSSLQITQAISKALKVDIDKAEKIKMDYNPAPGESNPKSKKVAQVITPILEDLISQIKKYLDFYQDHASHEHLDTTQKIEKIFLCGGGANFAGLPEFLSKQLGMPVELRDFWAGSWPKKSNNQNGKNFLSFATALGLALRGMKVE